MTLYYAAIVGDYERIITYWIFEENWKNAITALNSQVGRVHFLFQACLTILIEILAPTE